MRASTTQIRNSPIPATDYFKINPGLLPADIVGSARESIASGGEMHKQNIPKVRTVFLSDIHLGTRACQAERLLAFLREYDCEKLFLVGDIVDFWAMNRSIHWSSSQNTVVQKILRRARHDVRVVLVPGNHDEALRQYVGTSFGGIELLREHVHEAVDGKRYLIIHGDEFDQVTLHHRWVALLGDASYNFLVRINGWISYIRRKLGLPGYWSLAGYAKRKVKSAVSFIFNFEESVLRHVRERGLDGVICGHIHVAALRNADGITYANCGDWVDSCTAVVEHHDGRMELVHWKDYESAAESPPREQAAMELRKAA